MEHWKAAAHRLKRMTYTLALAYRDSRTPWYAKLVAALVVAYAFSPIDLIPDFIPVLGYLDDLILLPLGVALAVRLIPPAVLADAQQQADTLARSGMPASRAGVVVIAAIWIGLAALGIWFGVRLFS